MNSEREAYQIYKAQVIEPHRLTISLIIRMFQLGDEHERTRESAQVLKHLTEQAVVLQKRINDVVKGQSLVIPSLTVTHSILSLLSRFNTEFRFNNRVFKMS